MTAEETRLAAEIEPRAALVWPARETVALDGWLLRFTDGLTHRGNSVATFEFRGGDTRTAIERVEREYRSRGLPPMFQIASCVEPSDLAAKLLARGYEPVAPTFVRVAAVADLPGNLPSPGDVTMEESPGDEFCRLVREGSRSEADGRERIDILARVAIPHVCITAYAEGRVVACGTAANAQGEVGINLMRTDVSQRRKGHAQRVLAAIAGWAASQGVVRLHLGVEMANAAAIALYARAGFKPGYEYRYYRKMVE